MFKFIHLVFLNLRCKMVMITDCSDVIIKVVMRKKNNSCLNYREFWISKVRIIEVSLYVVIISAGNQLSWPEILCWKSWNRSLKWTKLFPLYSSSLMQSCQLHKIDSWYQHTPHCVSYFHVRCSIGGGGPLCIFSCYGTVSWLDKHRHMDMVIS
jgi:hypothetical protein